MTSHVLLVHGLYTGVWIMRSLGRKLEQQGFKVHYFGYRTTRQPLVQHAAVLADEVMRLYGQNIENLHFVGHSLGGLLLRHLAAARPDLVRGGIVTVGTPHQGSSVAHRIYRSAYLSRLLGETYHHGLDGNIPALPQSIALGSLAGNHAAGLGKVIGIKGENDGTVGVEETYCEGMQDHIVLPVTHTGMLFSTEVVAQVAAFLRNGHFIRSKS
ncbi:alpha/beta fold hydrolase [Neisseria zalophi]|uniref:Alpha/beta fold hydrolase n=1 Tax=Neisseria zalophi TaxID=640030 RepID=A0A5J6Q108_9NEIS|nr:alpha/beta fold hydrolase [Neisseria zalophi]QEY26872.1 alpha/beta fold hydrolase [Neisseria zalophi]